MPQSRSGVLPSILAVGFAITVIQADVHADVQESRGVEAASARTAALGGRHVALADDLASLFSNPAGFHTAGPEFSFAELTVGVAGPIFNISSIIVQGVSGVDVAELVGSAAVQEILQGLYASLSTVGPIAFGYVGSGLGFAFLNTTDAVFSTIGVIPTVYADVEESFLFSGGYAFRVPLSEASKTNLDFGALISAFVRGKVSLEKSVLELFSLFQNPSLDILMSQSFQLEIGIGLDLGVLLTLFDVLSFGLVGRNLYAPTLIHDYASLQTFLDSGAADTVNDGIVPMELAFGAAFTPSLGFLSRYITGFKLALDYDDILDFLTHPSTARNPILHMGMGLEISLLQILDLRAGFYGGLFAAGLGIDLSYFTLSAAMFGSELSTEPGLRSVYNLRLGLEFRY